MLHHYKPGAVRTDQGKPETVQSLVAAFDYAEYSQSELVGKKRRQHTAVVERDEYPEEEDFYTTDDRKRYWYNRTTV